MEAKLREYRALRRRKELIEKSSEVVADKVIGQDDITMKEDQVILIPEQKEELVSDSLEVLSETSEGEPYEDETQESWRYSLTKWTLYFIIWATVFLFFLKIRFGAVYFVISILIIICLNTRTRPKKTGEVSAYSVFNENCVSIDGTLTAEQFEREIRYGPGSVR